MRMVSSPPNRAGVIFEFERDHAGTLRGIPMIVRFNLDQCGVKLSAKQWSRLGHKIRAALVARPCRAEAETATYRNELIAAIRSHSAEEPKFIEIEQHPAWQSRDHVPAQLLASAAARHFPSIDVEQWSSLSDLQRFVLCKLTRAGHDNDNFESAMIEFGLLRAAPRDRVPVSPDRAMNDDRGHRSGNRL